MKKMFLLYLIGIVILASACADTAIHSIAPNQTPEEFDITNTDQIEKYAQDHNQEIPNANGLVEIKSEVKYDLDEVCNDIILYRDNHIKEKDKLALSIENVKIDEEGDQIFVYLVSDNESHFNQLVELFKERIINIGIIEFIQT